MTTTTTADGTANPESAPISKRPGVWIPEQYLRLPGKQGQVLGEIAQLSKGKGQCYAEVQHYCDRFDLSRRTLVHYLHELEQKDLIVRRGKSMRLQLTESAKIAFNGESANNAQEKAEVAQSSPDVKESAKSALSESPKKAQNLQGNAQKVRTESAKIARPSEYRINKKLNTELFADGSAAAEESSRPRDLLFDAIAEACVLDPAIQKHAALIGKVRKLLTDHPHPYTHAEVREAGKLYRLQHRQKIPTWIQLVDYIAVVRRPTDVANIRREAESFDRWKAKQENPTAPPPRSAKQGMIQSKYGSNYQAPAEEVLS